MTLFDVKSPVLRAVSGQADFDQTFCELDYIGSGGMLVRCERELAVGTEMTEIYVNISGYPEIFVAAGRVVGKFLGLTAIMFLGDSAELQELLDERVGGEQSDDD